MIGQKALKPIALIKTGCTIAQIRPRYGDFEDWFAKGMAVPDLLRFDVFRKQALPAPESLAGIVITGSPAMVSAKEDWSERTAEWLLKAIREGVSVLGVCYGHQLLAHALGGSVGPNPAGRQIGTVTAQLLDTGRKDALLGHLPNSFLAQTSHSEAVLDLPSDAERLAISPLDDNFSIRFAENVWGIQFHPEFSGTLMKEYIRLRSPEMRMEGLDPAKMQMQVTETPEAQSVLEKFVEILVQ